jgi:RNA polymerase sigma-70 factor (ECF subfamily)
MNDNAAHNREPLENYRGFLCYLAQLHVDPRLHHKLDPEDLVQDTFLKAHEAWHTCKAQTSLQVKAWLRTILIRRMLRKLDEIRRQVNGEVSIHDAVEKSSARIIDYLADEETTPGEHALRNERALQVEEALQQLGPNQREAVRLRHLQEWSLAEVGAHLGVSTAAVAGLLHRGITELAGLLPQPE